MRTREAGANADGSPERLAAFRTKWGQLEGEVVRLLAKDIELSLTFEQFDVSLHALVRCTNLLEQFLGEFRTKADEIGSTRKR